MIDGTAALVFLAWRTVRNRIAKQLSRLKTPRYALAAVFGVGYLVLVFGGGFSDSGAAEVGQPSIPLSLVFAIGLAATVWFWWLGPAPLGALAFQPAEVQFLFPAPLSRRQLIGYRLIRSQLGLLVTCLIWTVLARRWGTGAGPMLRFVSTWAMLTVVGLHRLGAALVLAGPGRGARRAAQWLGRGVAAASAAIVAGYTIIPSLLVLREQGADAGLGRLVTSLGSTPAKFAFAPFRILVAPLTAESFDGWIGPFGLLVGIGVVHLVWVLSMNVAFEEVAATAAANLARRVAAMKTGQGGIGAIAAPKASKRTRLPLAPVGHPAVAIVWKNTLAFLRSGAFRTIMILIGFLLVAAQLASGDGDERGSAPLAVSLATFAVMSLVMGPRMVRNDLRQDLQSLALLKTYPLSGKAILAAQIASPTALLVGFQVVLLMAAVVVFPGGGGWLVDPATTVAVVAVTPLLLVSLNGMSVAIQNGAALLFPGWVRLGADSGGFEAIGQNLLVTFGAFLVLVAALVLPGLAGAAAWYALGAFIPVAIVGAGVAGSFVLGLEVALLIRALGRVFERTDPTAIGS